jgi:hypothetical protein
MTTSNNTSANGTVAAGASASARALLARFRRLYNPEDNDGARPSVPHPGDILYWIACVGAVCALLFVATK